MGIFSKILQISTICSKKTALQPCKKVRAFFVLFCVNFRSKFSRSKSPLFFLIQPFQNNLQKPYFFKKALHRYGAFLHTCLFQHLILFLRTYFTFPRVSFLKYLRFPQFVSKRLIYSLGKSQSLFGPSTPANDTCYEVL